MHVDRVQETNQTPANMNQVSEHANQASEREPDPPMMIDERGQGDVCGRELMN
jgi:hypothetical protein